MVWGRYDFKLGYLEVKFGVYGYSNASVNGRIWMPKGRYLWNGVGVKSWWEKYSKDYCSNYNNK